MSMSNIFSKLRDFVGLNEKVEYEYYEDLHPQVELPTPTIVPPSMWNAELPLPQPIVEEESIVPQSSEEENMIASLLHEKDVVERAMLNKLAELKEEKEEYDSETELLTTQMEAIDLMESELDQMYEMANSRVEEAYKRVTEAKLNRQQARYQMNSKLSESRRKASERKLNF